LKLNSSAKKEAGGDEAPAEKNDDDDEAEEAKRAIMDFMIDGSGDPEDAEIHKALIELLNERI